MSSEKEKLSELVIKLDYAWDKFFKSVEYAKITIGSMKFLVDFIKQFKELKEYAGV